MTRSSSWLCTGVPDIGADPGSPKWVSRVVSLDHNYASGPRVRWGEVRVWYFERHQYSCSVPSHGDVALGMADTHSHTEHTSLGREEAELQGVSTKHKVNQSLLGVWQGMSWNLYTTIQHVHSCPLL